MNIPFPFELTLIFSTLAIFLLIGVLLRAKIPFFQKFLFPSCLIGGTLGLILKSTGVIDLVFDLKDTHLETFAYHFFNISFISVGLTRGAEQDKSISKGRQFASGPLWMAIIQGITFPLQALVGGLLVLLFGLLGTKLFPTFGFLVPLGFTEGPGQALSVGKVWEFKFGFTHGATLGLTFATIGFFFAFFIGVPLVNWAIRKGHSKLGSVELSPEFLKGFVPKTQKKESAGELTMHSGNIDTLAFQTAMVGVVYAITYAFVLAFGKFLSADAAAILWGFFFFFGMLFALIIRIILGKIGIDYLIDPGVQRRITGGAVDFLIVSTVMAIQLVVVWQFILPVSVIAITIGILTTLVVVYFGKRIDSYNIERTAAIYGTVTGTVSSGLLLLRIVDPEFKTPAAMDVALMNVVVAPVIAGLMVLVNAPVWWNWSVGLTIAVFAAVMLTSVFVLWLARLWGEPKF